MARDLGAPVFLFHACHVLVVSPNVLKDVLPWADLSAVFSGR